MNHQTIVVMTREDLDATIINAAKAAVDEAMRRIPSRNGARPLHVNQSQAAEMLNISRPTLSKLVKSGKIKLNACGLIPIDLIDSIAAETKSA